MLYILIDDIYNKNFSASWWGKILDIETRRLFLVPLRAQRKLFDFRGTTLHDKINYEKNNFAGSSFFLLCTDLPRKEMKHVSLG